MKNLQSASSKWLVGIGLAAAALVVASVVVALVNNQRESNLISEDKPEGVAQRYLLALKQGEFNTAYGYLNARLKQACTYGSFLDVVRYYEDRDTGVTLVRTESLDGKREEVVVRITEYNVSPPFGGNEFSQTVHYVLEQEEAAWRFAELPWPLSWCPGMDLRITPVPAATQ